MKDLSNTQYKSIKPEEHLHERMCHKEEKAKKRQGFFSKNMRTILLD
jgi:hypothetical protein